MENSITTVIKETLIEELQREGGVRFSYLRGERNVYWDDIAIPVKILSVTVTGPCDVCVDVMFTLRDRRSGHFSFTLNIRPEGEEEEGLSEPSQTEWSTHTRNLNTYDSTEETGLHWYDDY